MDRADVGFRGRPHRLFSINNPNIYRQSNDNKQKKEHALTLPSLLFPVCVFFSLFSTSLKQQIQILTAGSQKIEKWHFVIVIYNS